METSPEPKPTGIEPRLKALPEGSSVAIVTLLGTLCPVTLGHVQGFLEARALLLRQSAHPVPKHLEAFAECLGYISLNGDGHVRSKMRQAGCGTVNYADRKHLVQLAIEEHDWMEFEEGYEGKCVEELSARWPALKFVHYCMNGADDVVKYRKYSWGGPKNRFITMGRLGFTEEVEEGMVQSRVDLDAGYFILGPELPDISSSAVRAALAKGDMKALETLLHPKVSAWCVENRAFCT